MNRLSVTVFIALTMLVIAAMGLLPIADSQGQQAPTTIGLNSSEGPLAPNLLSNIILTASSDRSFGKFIHDVESTELGTELNRTGPFTVFAPTNDAFAKLPDKTKRAILNDKKNLTAVLKYHVVEGDLTVDNLSKLRSIKTLQGESLSINSTNGLKVNDINITQPNIICSNGVIYPIDTVLIPPV